jgi:hypothetical protein
MFDVIERLKSDWTDKYVVIDSSAPELARFATATGIVKTVNMNGRCLVEFDQYNNIGWYDIDPSCLKIVPKPLPKPAETKEKAKPAAKAAPAKEAAKPAAAKKPSTADILAAARAKGGATAAKPAAEAAPAAGGKLSTAEILARARGAKAAAAPAPAAEVTAEPAAEEPPAPAPAAKKPAAKAAAGGQPTTTAEKIAWCRANDAKG